MREAPIIQPGDKVCVLFPGQAMLNQDPEELTKILEDTYPGVDFEVGDADIDTPVIAWIYRDPDGYLSWHKSQREKAASEVVGITPEKPAAAAPAGGYQTPVGYQIKPHNFDGGQAL